MASLSFSINQAKMILKEIIKLFNQSYVYAIEDEDGVFLYRKNGVTKYSLLVECRKTKCRKMLKLKPISNVRYLFIFRDYKLEKIKDRIRYNMKFSSYSTLKAFL